MQRLVLVAVVLLALLCVPCVANPALDDLIIEIPFSFAKGHVTVQAKIKEKLPVEVVLATGVEHSTIDAGLLDKYKLPAYYSAEPPITGRNDRLYSFTTVPDVRVGGLKETSLNMRFGSLSEISQRLGREIFGILGADFFRGRVVQFDFGKKVVRFLPQSPADSPKDKVGTDAIGRAVLPMRFYKEYLTLPIVEDVTFNGKEIKTLFDTGTVTVVSVSAAAAKKIGLAFPPENSPPRADKVSSLRFAEHELNDVPILLYAKGSDFDRAQKEYGAVAGVGLLQNFVVTFDFRKKVIILEYI